jgi:hypothetical protein
MRELAVGDRGEEWRAPRISPVVLTVWYLGAMATHLPPENVHAYPLALL